MSEFHYGQLQLQGAVTVPEQEQQQFLHLSHLIFQITKAAIFYSTS